MSFCLALPLAYIYTQSLSGGGEGGKRKNGIKTSVACKAYGTLDITINSEDLLKEMSSIGYDMIHARISF